MKKTISLLLVGTLLAGCGGENEEKELKAVDDAKKEIEAKEREAAGLAPEPSPTPTPVEVVEVEKPVPMSAERIGKQYELAEALYEEGEYLEAKKRMTKAYASFGLLKEKDPEDRDKYLLLLCQLSYSMLEADDLIRYAEEWGAVGSFPPRFLGRSYAMKEDYDKAIAYFKKADALDVEEYGPETAMSAVNYGDIGETYRNKGEYDKAIQYSERALAIKLKVYGPEDKMVATSYANIGLAYDNKGEYDKAIEYYEKSLAIKLKTLGPEHPEVATSYFNMGAALSAKGDKPKALAYLQKAKAIWVKQLGPDHQNVKDAQWWIDKTNKK